MNRNKKTVMAILAVVTIVCVAIVAVILIKPKIGIAQAKPTDTQSDVDEYGEDTSSSYRTITYNGKKYTYNQNLSTVLFLGVDQHEKVESYGYKGTGGRSDCIILLIMDSSNKTVKMLEISRDTMVDVAVYDTSGEYALDMNMQITMQYSYGDGANKSCRLTKEAVSKLLYGIPIDNYFSMNIDGISTVTDAVGGVTLTVPQDYTDVDPQFTQGATLKLDGVQAEKYVRKRDTSVTGSNDGRMERQMQYIRALVAQLQSSATGVSTYQSLLDKASDYIVTDMQADDLYALTKCSLDDKEYKVAGQTVKGIANDEYHVDEQALQKQIIDLFYVEN